MPTASLPSTGPTCLATVTCEPSPPLTEIGRSISSAAASRAKTSALRARGQGSQERGLVFGTSLQESFAKLAPDGSLWRTSAPSLLGDSEPFSKTWPASGLMRNGTAYQLVPLVRRTAGNESGLWPTPKASAAGPDFAKTTRSKTGISLATAAAMYPTPTVQDASNNGGPSQYERNSLPLNAVAGGALNPTWVEWLMGFPLGWTDLGDSATPSSRKSSKSSGGRSSKRKPK